MQNKNQLTISSYEELLNHEQEILRRIEDVPNGGNLFLIHPFLLFEDIGVKLTDDAKVEILTVEPQLTGLSETPYRALKASKSSQNSHVRLRGLFSRRSV